MPDDPIIVPESTLDKEVKERRARLIAKPRVEKVWAAVKAVSDIKARIAKLGDKRCWVGIEEVGDFLRRRQIDAARTKFSDKDPNTRYALKPNPVHRNKWDEHTIVTALSEALECQILELMRREDGNYFTYVPEELHDLWKIKDTSTPTLPEWRKPFV